MIEIGTLLQERYLIEKQIGAGGMGAVYLAIDKRFENHVAIKETFYKDDEFGEAFEREARLLNALQHQVLPHVTDYFSENNGYFLVMQFIEGEDLSDILKRQGSFPVKEVVRWTESLLDALDYLHSQTPPIIHRDIKPHNLKLTPRGDIMLLDFGLAKLNSEDTLGAVSVFGYSRTYSPLEQIQGTGTDARSDIFALGATVYHLLTGKAPVNALTRAAAIVNGKEDPIQLASELNPEISLSVASVINSAIALNPENRFISAQAMRQALEYAVRDEKDFVGAAAQPVETIPQVVPIAANAPIIDSAENENFPALEAFAAVVEQNNSETAPPNGTPIIPDSADNFAENETPETSVPENRAAAPIIVETSSANKRFARKPRRKNSFLPLAAAAAVLILGIIAVAVYFSREKDPNPESSQAPPTETNSTVKSNRKTAEKNVPSTEIVAESKSKPQVSTETAEKTVETDAPRDENAETPSENPVVESVRATRNKAKNQALNPQKTEPEVVDENSTTDAAEVESVFTGRENETRNNRTERRRDERAIPDEMSEEEFEQMRREQRQRRRERRERRNNDQIPF